MTSVHLRGHVDENGVLRIPGLRDLANSDVAVVVMSVNEPEAACAPEGRPRTLAELAGSVPDFNMDDGDEQRQFGADSPQ